jgi:threonine synthase
MALAMRWAYDTRGAVIDPHSAVGLPRRAARDLLPAFPW